jgi:Cu+-exporting ATPase
VAIDPICGMTVDEGKAISAEKDGKKTFFCCEACRRKFLGLPPLPAPSRSSNAYFCPMCEGVESDRPGICPTCGMALESATLGAEDDSELRDMERRFVVGLVFGLPVLVLAMGSMLHGGFHRLVPPDLSRWLEFALATPVVIGCGGPLFQRAWRSVLTLRLNMFTLIGVGTGTAYIFSAVAMLRPGLVPAAFLAHGRAPVYFEAASTITLLVLLGQVLELRARRKTGAAIRELMKLAPEKASVLRDGVEREVGLAEVRAGDLLRVRPGGRVPVDGVLMEGRGSIDMSMLTGEPMPVDREAGDPVAAGTINLSGAFVMRAEKVGAETMLARIVQMVSSAQRSRAPIQRLADRAAAVFVPLVFAAAALAFAAWAWFGPEPRLAHALVAGVSVLIVACPCALGLATPMAIMVGVGRGARAGVLIRDAEVLERLRGVDTVVVDKTGTLTEGRPTVTAIHCVSEAGQTEAALLQLAASVEHHSEHPLGKAIVRHALAQGAILGDVTEFESFAGGGVSGVVGGRRVFVGKMAGSGVAEDAQTRLEAEGGTVVAVTVDGETAGHIALADRIRDSTPEAVRRLQAMGLRVVMLTGDAAPTAAAVARKLGIDDVEAGLSPAAKLDRIAALRAAGHRVAMAGDGINDAPALAAADVGMAMGTGTDAAMESAGVVLVKGDLHGIARAVTLSRATLRNIRQNLCWAFGYNLLGVPVAAGALYPIFGLLLSPMMAAAAMSFSSVSVIANALRLRRLKL